MLKFCVSQHSYFTVPDIRELPSIPENLTACIHGSAAMLYPMFWQHVYIPVLPPHLLDYCCAPMPYLIGIHLSLMEKVRNMALEDVVILNVDTNTLETPFDDLQNLPNDVVSALKNRLKKVSTTTGDGVARAFLKAQASFFGSYRNALKIEPGEPITFCEETFVSHRSAVMRQFLQNAIQLQLFKQFIDGRLDLLNSGEGFSDVFEEEINMGEYAALCLALPVDFPIAVDGVKDITENGCSAAPEEALPRTAPSPLVEKKDPKLREDRRPITVHFGQVRPPRPHVVKRPKSNIAVEGRRTSVSSPEHLVKPMRHYTVFLSEDSSDDEFQQEEDPVSGFSENFFFSAPFEWSILYSFIVLIQPSNNGFVLRMDLGVSERNRIVPTMKLSHPYNKLWSMGQDDMAIPTKCSQSSPERPLTALGTLPPMSRRPRSRDSVLAPAEKDESNPAIQGNITIPRPQGRKTPELGIVPPPPPASRASKHQTPTGPTEILTPHTTGCSPLVSDLIPEPFGVGSVSLDPEIQHSVNYSSRPSQLLSGAASTAEMLQPVKVKTDNTDNESDYLLNLLDPLKTASWQSSGPQQAQNMNVIYKWSLEFQIPFALS
ncbi:hypothetical protein llap_8646 [Limosa lapponica baueri]|uniref:UDENN domain-containing protein n=1 Tax=Limosa lapponica baueri TaxID=1758121 RepID=A0A2I0U4N5_LIMLA|nr:hypothetical protein llap_8646 [Limosa lapponica baueri]